MRLKKPSAVRFQINVRARIPKDTLPLLGKEVVNEAVERWFETGVSPDNFRISVTIWQHGKGREITSIGDDPKGGALRERLRGALKSGQLNFQPLGTSR